MANFSGALLVCSLMKTARQQEKGAPSEGEEPESHIHQWLGTWSLWPWDILPCWDVTSTKPLWHPTAGLGVVNAAGHWGPPLTAAPWVGNRHSHAKYHGRVFPNLPPPAIFFSAKSSK